jgi:hypothetical protein
MSAEVVQSSRSKSVTTRVVATVLRAFVEIGAAIKSFISASHPASAERCSESSVVEIEAVTAGKIAAPSEVKADAEVSPVARNELDEQEIERRRSLVRALFNDFWRGQDQKPISFTARLDQAEDYLNERLATNRETWRLDGETRVMLGLPPRSSSRA